MLGIFSHALDNVHRFTLLSPLMAISNAEYIGVSDLAAAVGEALSEIAKVDRRMKSGATEIPSERTIRFYLEKGLLPKPSKRLGQTLVFGRVHLLTLLVIKKLQSDGVPLSAIPGILKKSGRTEAQLEGLLGGESSRPVTDIDGDTSPMDLAMATRQRTVLRSTSSEPQPQTGSTDGSTGSANPDQRPRAHRVIIEPRKTPPAETTATPLAAAPPPGGEAKSFLKSLLSRSAKPQSQATEKKEDFEVLFSKASPTSPAKWMRHEPTPGLEINISDDYEPPADEQGKAKLLETIRRVLGL